MQEESIFINIIQRIYDFFYDISNYVKGQNIKLLFILSFIAFSYLLFYIFTHNPHNILKSFTPVFILLYVVLTSLLISIFVTNDVNKLPIIFNFIKLVSFVLLSYLVFRVVFYISGQSFLYIGKESPIFAIFLVLSLMAIFYKSFIQDSRRKSKSSSYNIFIDIFFYLPCLLLDSIEFFKTQFSSTTNTNVLLLSGISIAVIYKYILPILQNVFTKKDRVKLLSNAQELDHEILNIDQDTLREKVIETQPFIKRKMLKITNDIEKLIREQGSIFEKNNLFDLNEIYSNKQVISNYNMVSTLGDYGLCKNSKNINCDSSTNQMLCDGENVIDFYNMKVLCDSNVSSFTNNIQDDITLYHSQDKTERRTLPQICSFDNDLSNTPTQVECINYDEVSQFVLNPDAKYEGKMVYACDAYNVEKKSSNKKYKVIVGYNDVNENETALECGVVDVSAIEGFTTELYNPKIHALDVNTKTKDIISLFSDDEQEIIQKTLDEDDGTFEYVLKLYSEDPNKAKAYIISYFSNNNKFMTLLDHINHYNIESKSYLNQEISEIIKYYHRNNNIETYNYHYAISFWIYFDTSILNHHESHAEGLIMDYGNQPRIVYDYKTQELVIKIKNCDKLIRPTNQTCGEDTIYKTDKILFQKWNNIIVNFNYGTLDLFVNNNLVSSTKGVSPYINDNHYSIVFGSEKHPLPGCAICNVEYFNLPMGLNQIKNNYKKKNNPCK